jgi:uncharacterized protein YggL (DUF469 family)
VALFIVSVNVIESGFVSGFVVLFCIPSILILGVTHADHVAQIEQKKKSIERATRRAQSVCMHFSEFQSLGLTIETDFFGGRVNCISFKK